MLTADFEVLTTNQRHYWRGSLGQAVHFCREVVAELTADISCGRMSQCSCVKSNLQAMGPEGARLLEGLPSIRDDYPLEMKSPFENVDSIAGGIWHVSELFADDSQDAILKLRFRAGTQSLPLHRHEFSERVVIVLDGAGEYHVAAGSEIRSTAVGVGDVLAFSRGVSHTFKTFQSDLLLLSYHRPFIPLDDPRQYTLS